MFKENKKYRLIEPMVEEFCDESFINKKLYDELNLSNWFTVLEIIDEDVKCISLENGDIIDADDFGIYALFDKDEFKYFQGWIEPGQDEKVVLLKRPLNGCPDKFACVQSSEVEKYVKEFLNAHPGGKVEIFRLAETALLKSIVVYE